jgi:putative two-component system response regulator
VTTNTARQTVLVVDDTPMNIEILGRLLQQDYRVKVANDGRSALIAARNTPKPDIILLDVMMPGMDGYEVCQTLKADPATAPIPVIFVTAMGETEDEKRGLELGAVDYIVKPFSPAIVQARLKTQLALYDQNRTLEEKVRLRTDEVCRIRLEIIHRLGRAAEYRDNETGLHVIRMSHYSRRIAEKLDVAAEWTELLFNAAPMHDVGKIGIPDHILLKPGALDSAEWLIMKRHPEIGADIIGEESSELMRLSRQIALGHHEKYDGSGYPNGQKGEDIPLSARIVAIADVFDALTTPRPYKKAWPVAEAVAHINASAGSHFDPALVAVFNSVLEPILSIKETYGETEALAVA